MKLSGTRFPRHPGERGAAVFIVVLVLSMLTAIGIFAASSASLATSASGNERMATQTRYVTEYALNLTVAELGNTGLDGVRAAAQTATANGVTIPCAVPPPLNGSCWVFTRVSLETVAGEPLLDPAILPAPGSLGYADLGWDFVTDVSVEDQNDTQGNDTGPGGPVAVRYCPATVNVRGTVWPNTSGSEDQVINASGHQALVGGTLSVLCSK